MEEKRVSVSTIKKKYLLRTKIALLFLKIMSLTFQRTLFAKYTVIAIFLQYNVERAVIPFNTQVGVDSKLAPD